MLTKTDLEQIRVVVKGEINPFKKAIESGDKELSTKIDILDKKLDKVQEDVGEYLNHLEPRVTIVEKRVDNIEEHLDPPRSQ